MGENQEELKKSAEKIWDATRKTFQSATFQANRYKKLVQKKIDVASLHKKISATHADLGKVIDDAREAQEGDIISSTKVVALFEKLDSLKHSAAELEQEIEAIKSEVNSPETSEEEH